MKSFKSFSGIVVAINRLWGGFGGKEGCIQLMTVENNDRSIVNFVITPQTYFVDRLMINPEDFVTIFYDANEPTPFIFPPQLRALVVVKSTLEQQIKVDYFNDELVSADGTLKLEIVPVSQIILVNGQAFSGMIENSDLIVEYNSSTKSIPAITVPQRVIVMCE